MITHVTNVNYLPGEIRHTPDIKNLLDNQQIALKYLDLKERIKQLENNVHRFTSRLFGLDSKKSDLHFSMSALESEIKLREGQPLQIFAGFWNYLAKIEIF